MENFSYVQDGGRNYLKSEPVGEVDYIVGMFAHNDIPAFVPVSFKSLNLENYFCYNMNGLIPINQSFEMNKLTADRIEAFLRSIIKAAKSMEEFLLPFDRLITDEAYIYESLGKKDEFHWIYGIESGSCTFTRLFERLLDRVDYKDDSAVKMIYSLYQAAKDAEIHEFIMSLPNGYDTIIGDGYIKLSGGEKQRISIARCLLKNSPIVILDEITAYSDIENEAKIQSAIRNLLKDKTAIIIAHRLYTIKDVDNIVVLNEGEIVESGKHQDLITKENGLYKHLWEVK